MLTRRRIRLRTAFMLILVELDRVDQLDQVWEGMIDKVSLCIRGIIIYAPP